MLHCTCYNLFASLIHFYHGASLTEWILPVPVTLHNNIIIYPWQNRLNFFHVFRNYIVTIHHWGMMCHDDVIFRVTGPLCGEFTDHRWIRRIKSSDAELCYFLRSASEQTVEQTIETPAIWDANALIMTSLQRVSREEGFQLSILSQCGVLIPNTYAYSYFFKIYSIILVVAYLYIRDVWKCTRHLPGEIKSAITSSITRLFGCWVILRFDIMHGNFKLQSCKLIGKYIWINKIVRDCKLMLIERYIQGW